MRIAVCILLVLAVAMQTYAWQAIPEPSSPIVAQKQEWVMSNCPVGAKWDFALLRRQIGEEERVAVTKRDARVFEAYYFSAAEMTLLRNKLKDTVATYTWGKTGDL